MEDADKILAPGGAAELFLKARDEGKVRFVGFSAHHPAAAIRLMDAFPCDSILFPVNFHAWGEGKFGPQMMAHAKKKGVARLALKAMALREWPEGADRKWKKCWYEPIADEALARDAVRWTLSEDVTAAIPPGEKPLFEMALNIAAEFKPMTADERVAMTARDVPGNPVFRA